MTIGEDWVKRIAVSYYNSALGEVIWDGINYAGNAVYAPQTFLWQENSGGNAHLGFVEFDDCAPVLSNVQVVNTGCDLCRQLSFRFVDDDTYSGMVRAQILELEYG